MTESQKKITTQEIDKLIAESLPKSKYTNSFSKDYSYGDMTINLECVINPLLLDYDWVQNSFLEKNVPYNGLTKKHSDWSGANKTTFSGKYGEESSYTLKFIIPQNKDTEIIDLEITSKVKDYDTTISILKTIKEYTELYEQRNRLNTEPVIEKTREKDKLIIKKEN